MTTLDRDLLLCVCIGSVISFPLPILFVFCVLWARAIFCDQSTRSHTLLLNTIITRVILNPTKTAFLLLLLPFFCAFGKWFCFIAYIQYVYDVQSALELCSKKNGKFSPFLLSFVRLLLFGYDNFLNRILYHSHLVRRCWRFVRCSRDIFPYGSHYRLTKYVLKTI